MSDALLGALIGGGATCIAAYLAIRQQSLLARHEIEQDRFAEVYTTLQIYIARWADHANWARRFVRLAGEVEPELPQISDIEEARASLFASDAVVEATKAFSQLVLRYRLAVGDHGAAVKAINTPGVPHPDISQVTEEWQASAADLIAAADKVHELLRADLRGIRRRGPSS